MSKYLLLLISLIIVLSVLRLFSVNPIYASTIVKPQLIWQRSTEAQDKVVQETVIGSKVNEALALPPDPNQTVFDNGVSTPTVNKNAVASGISWASWAQYSSNGTTCGPIFDLRHFQAKFNLPSGFSPANVEKVRLKSPYYPGDTFPINDNAYIYINGNFARRLGTSYGAANVGMHGIAPYANETDGWIANGDLGTAPAQFLHSGQNVIDIVAGEWCLWGGMGKLELVLEGQFSTVPYFSQIDPIWGNEIYDHADRLNLDCEIFGGSTIAACGCAVSSSAMILKYYGVDKSPTGESTDPGVLNNWLKVNQGYDYGNLKWTSISAYALKAHEKFGTQKIKFVGFGNGPDDFTTLNEDLNNGKPPILEQPNHFIVATGIQGATYSINDPRWQNKTTLESYGGHFKRMRRFEKTFTDLSTIYISTPTPTHLFLQDTQGRRVGKDPATGIIYNEIPNSFYILEPALVDDSAENASLPPEDKGVNTLMIINPDAGDFSVEISNTIGSYDVSISGYDRNGDINVQRFNQLLPQDETHEYQLNYSPEPGSQINITQIVNIDIKPGSDPNSINLKSNGLIPVAFLTIPGFDATQVDVATVRFGPNKATETHNKGHLEDVDGDGDIDLMLHFKTQETGIKNSDTQACLTGTTLSGILIHGCDSVRIAGK